MNNPMNYVDPTGMASRETREKCPKCPEFDGEIEVFPGETEEQRKWREAIERALERFFWDAARFRAANEVLLRAYIDHQRINLYGTLAFADGVIPLGDPFEGVYSNSMVDGLDYSQMAGEITASIEVTLATSGWSAIFARGKWINSGRYFRVGHRLELVKNASNRVWFSLRGEWITKLAGRSHVNLWIVRYLPPGVAK